LLAITECIDALLRSAGPFPGHEETPAPYQVPLSFALDLIDRLGPTFVDFAPGFEDRWDPAEYKAILQHLSENSTNAAQRGKVFILVRTGRNLNRTAKTAAYADNPDTSQREGVIAREVATDIPVLMMIRQNGAEAQGWKGCPFWWPVILTPANTRTTLFAQSRSRVSLKTKPEPPNPLLNSRARRAGDFITKQLGASPKWGKLNEVLWAVIGKREVPSFSLSDIDHVAKAVACDSNEVLAVLGLLSKPSAGILKMEFRAGSPAGAEVSQSEFNDKLTDWWRNKSLSDPEWQRWASTTIVRWVPAEENEVGQ
jgi:hypothetical protein